MKTALTIAGSDPSGGAGIQADIKTMTAHGVYAMSAITALTAQNTMGVTGIEEVEPCFLGKQLDCIFSDIYPDAVKIGMLPSSESIKVTAQKLAQYNAKHIVLDPVMVSTSGTPLMKKDAVSVMKDVLFPLAELITPNIPEAQLLSEMSIQTKRDMEMAAEIIWRNFGCAVLCKGGHSVGGADDVLCTKGKIIWFQGNRIDNPNTHGTGCTLSSAIASNIALGNTLEAAIRKAKDYLSGALASGLDLGKGPGPLNHVYRLEKSL